MPSRGSTPVRRFTYEECVSDPVIISKLDTTRLCSRTLLYGIPVGVEKAGNNRMPRSVAIRNSPPSYCLQNGMLSSAFKSSASRCADSRPEQTSSPMQWFHYYRVVSLACLLVRKAFECSIDRYHRHRRLDHHVPGRSWHIPPRTRILTSNRLTVTLVSNDTSFSTLPIAASNS